MSRLFWQNMITLDGFFEGPNHELDWHVIDEDFDAYGREMLSSIEGFVLGRATYELFASHWPTSQQGEAPLLNALPKYVVSRTLEHADWNNTTILRSVEDVARVKREAKRDLALFGSGELGSALMRAGLIDEFRVMVAPVVLGAGRPMFKGIEQRASLKLTRSETYRSGVTHNRYEPA